MPIAQKDLLSVLLAEVEGIWKDIVNVTISCVLDNSPNDAVLASYLGKGVENKYRVLIYWSYDLCIVY